MCLLSCVLCVRVVWCAGSLFANWPNCGKYEWHGVVISAGCGLLSTLYRFLIRLEWALQSRAGVLIFTFFGTNTMGSIRKWWCCSVVREFTLRWLYPNKQFYHCYYLTPDVTQHSQAHAALNVILLSAWNLLVLYEIQNARIRNTHQTFHQHHQQIETRELGRGHEHQTC